MNRGDLLALLPLLVTAGTAVAVMLAVACRRHHRLTAGLTLVGLAGALAALAAAWPLAPRQVTSLLIVDRYALFYTGLILGAGLAVAMLSCGYVQSRQTKCEEFYILLLLATAGAAVLAASDHFASLFLGLELLSVSLYALVGYQRNSLAGMEAAVKYLILAGVSSAFLLFGMAIVYAQLGTMQFALMGQRAAGAAGGVPLLAGMGMILVGIGFKLGLVPFHLWTPDVYQGAPAPVTAFIATASKGAVFALLLRYFSGPPARMSAGLTLVFALMAAASMLAGNLLALRQRNVKRLLAYSSIAHMGYLLVAFLASGALAPTAVAFYLLAYFATTLGAFGVVTVLSGPDRQADDLDDYRGLAWRRPGLAAIFTAMLLSLAGIPLTAGFVGKFYVLAAGTEAGLWALTVALAVNSAIGLFYYLRVLAALYSAPAAAPAPAGGAPGPGSSGRPPAAPALPAMAGLALSALTLVVVWLGVNPSPAIRLIQSAVNAVP